MVTSTGTHTIWSILPWDVPWDAGHGVFLGLTYVILGVLGATLGVAVFRTWKTLRDRRS